MEEKGKERNSSKAGEKRDEQRSNCQDDFQNRPFYTLGYLGQIPKKAMYSHSIPDTHKF